MGELDLESVCKKVLFANPDKVNDYYSGKAGILGFLVGCVMVETENNENPVSIMNTIKNLLHR